MSDRRPASVGSSPGGGGVAAFMVAVVARRRDEAAGDPSGGYGDEPWQWRPFGAVPEPAAAYTATVADRFGLPVRIVDFTAARPDLARSPGLILIDPWSFAAMDPGTIRRLLSGLPDWAMPVVLFDRNDEPSASSGVLLARQVTDMLESIGAAKVVVVSADQEFVQRVPKLVLDARRQFLSKAHVFPPSGSHPPRPRFGNV